MVQRYVRVQDQSERVYYGILHLDRTVQTLDAPPWLQGQMTEFVMSEGEYTLLAPCAPSKIIAVGKNYAKHAAEMGTPLPIEPLLFFKPPTAVLPHRGVIQYPPQSQRVDYEGELAIIMGDRAVQCDSETAEAKIWGYTIANDVTARDLQTSDGQWTRAKGFDTFCPLGPWIVREVNPEAKLQTVLNDQLVQSTPLSDRVFSSAVLVAYISQVMTLLPGDVILTGTPEGVGPMQPGDRIRVSIEGIGSLENTIERRQDEAGFIF